MGRPKARTRRTFGAVRKLPSGRIQAKYTGPDGQWHKAPHTFDYKEDAEGWLSTERKLISMGEWTPPAVRREQATAAAAQAETANQRAQITVRDLCDRWLGHGHLKESTVTSHRGRMNRRVLNTALADMPVIEVTRAHVNAWWREVQDRWPETGNSNAHSYRHLHTMFQWATDELELIDTNPVRIKGARNAPRPKVRDRPLITPEEAKAMAEGVRPRLRTPVELLLWCGLRIGELLELRRKDLIGLSGTGPVTVRVRRDAVRVTVQVEDPTTGEMKNKQVMRSFSVPKTAAGNRDIVVPPQVAERLRKHCREYVAADPDAFIIPTRSGGITMDTSFRTRMKAGTAAANRPDVTPHDCRRFYGTMLVNNGVPLEEARYLLGHESVSQLLDYQRAASGYEQRAAGVLDRLID